MAQLTKQAKAAFTHIQACMTSAEAAPAFLRAIVQVGVAESALRDELWCQLIKQTTGCHDTRAMALGLKVIVLLLPACQPSASFVPHPALSRRLPLFRHSDCLPVNCERRRRSVAVAAAE